MDKAALNISRLMGPNSRSPISRDSQLANKLQPPGALTPEFWQGDRSGINREKAACFSSHFHKVHLTKGMRPNGLVPADQGWRHEQSREPWDIKKSGGGKGGTGVAGVGDRQREKELLKEIAEGNKTNIGWLWEEER